MFRFANWPLHAKLAALLAAVSLLPLGVSTYLDLAQTRDLLLDGMQQVLRARGDQIVRELESFHEGYQRSVDRITRFPATAMHCAADAARRAADRAGILGLLGAFPASDPGIRGAALIDGAGRVIAATESALVGVDLSQRLTMRAALQGGSYISDPYLGSPQTGAQPTIAYLAPMLDADRRVLCVAALWVRAEMLWKRLESSDALAGPQSYAVLFDREGIRIGHTQSGEVVFRPAGALEPAILERIVSERRFGARTRELLEDVRPFPEHFERARAARPDPAVFRAYSPTRQGWTYGVARRFESVPWTVFYMVPEEHISARVTQEVRGRLLIGAALIALAAVAGLLFAGSIVRPIRALGRAAEAIGGGDLTARAAGTTGADLGRLRETFNDMAERIQAQSRRLERSRDELEQRVRDRTATLEASEQRTRSIVDTAIDAVVTMDRRGVITGWSPQAEVIFGWSRAEALGRTVAETLVPQSQRDAHRSGLARYVSGGPGRVLNRRLEMVALHRDGHEFPVDLSITPLHADAGVEFCAYLRDITERKAAEVRLRAQLERLQLLDQITCAIGARLDLRSIYGVAVCSLEERLPVDFCGVCSCEPDRNVLTVVRLGPAAASQAGALGLDERSPIAVDENGLARCVGGELVYEPDTAALHAQFPQRLASGGLRALVAAPLQAEGRVIGVLLVARRARASFSSGECEFVRQLSAHIALAAQQAQLYGALQQAYDELRASQQAALRHERLRALGQMASGVAHDINNAIAPVALYAESLLEGEPQLSARGREQLTIIARAVDDVAATVARMREFYRHDEGSARPGPLNLELLARQVIDLTRARWSDIPQQRGAVIRLVTQFAADLPEVSGVESEVREALINLVFNAVDAMPEGGVLTLRTLHTAEGAVLEVADSGVGMDEATRQRCLEPFFTTKGERGTGLGLSMVYGIAQRHGAAISIDSAVGRGTVVRLSFPLPTDDTPAPVPDAPAPAPAASLRLLLVDDDPLVLRSLRDSLERDGHRVTAAGGGQEGIAEFERGLHAAGAAYDAVITDLGMPYVDGHKVAAQVKRAAPSTPVILLTGWGQRLAADGDAPAPADHVMSKPAKLDELRRVLAQACKKYP